MDNWVGTLLTNINCKVKDLTARDRGFDMIRFVDREHDAVKRWVRFTTLVVAFR